MKSLLNAIVALGIAGAFAPAAHADFHAPQDNAVQRLHKPPGQRVSSRIQKDMDRMAKNGLEDARLREMLARKTLDKNVDHELVRADRQKDPRAKIAGYESALSKVHPNNLIYKHEILKLIAHQLFAAKLMKTRGVELETRIATVKYEICEIQYNGYSRSRPTKEHTKHAREAKECMAQMCDHLKRFKQSCPGGGPGTTVARVNPDPKPQPKKRPPAKSRPRPPSVDPNAGRLQETQMFYIAGLPRGSSVPILSQPNDRAQVIGRLRAGDRLAARTAPSGSDKARGYVRVCPPGLQCGWVREKYATHGTQFAAARRAADYYMIALHSSSVRGMLELVTGPARKTFERLDRQHPGKRMKDVATELPERWNAQCVACDGDVCQLLYKLEGGKLRGRDLIILEAQRGRDAKYRLAATRNYADADKRWFDDMHPHCWKR